MIRNLIGSFNSTNPVQVDRNILNIERITYTKSNMVLHSVFILQRPTGPH